MQPLDYTITPADPRAHVFRVRLVARLPDTIGDTSVRLFLPGWIPGSYVVRDFARHLLSITAHSAGWPVAVEPVDRQSWRCAAAPGVLEVVCEFYARDESVRAAFLDELRGFFNPTSLCLRIQGMDDAPCNVRLALPEGIDDWQVTTTLPARDVDTQGFGEYRADSYWQLIDHPVAMGHEIERVEFSLRDVPHAFVLLGPHDADTQQLAKDLTDICEQQAAVFGALPVGQYLFLAQIAPSGYGGLEHRECSVLQIAREALPAVGAPTRGEAYETLLGLCSHEYFHLWNVKRIRPAAVADSDLTAEAYFRDLWAYEGVTSYYDDLALVRAGVLSPESYLSRLAKLATRIEAGPGEQRQSLAQSSFDAWLKFYRPDENTPNAVVSYYGKGAQVALALDLKLRYETQDRVSLNDVMRLVWQRYGAPDTPAPEGALERLAAEASGLDLNAFFDRHLRTTAAAPWADLMAAFGIRATRAPADDDASLLLGRLGLRLVGNDQPPRILHVLDGGAAQVAGLSPGDRLIAIDGIEAGTARLAAFICRYPAGARLRVHLFRGDLLLVRELVTGAQAAPRWILELDAEADEAACNRRARWLGEGAGHPGEPATP